MVRPPHSDYLDGVEPDPEDFLMQVVLPSSPDSPTRGDVVITLLERGIDQWVGVWRLDTGEWDGEYPRIDQLGSCFGNRADVVRWARAQDAATRWIFDERTGDFVRLA